MDQVMFYCEKCDYEGQPFERLDHRAHGREWDKLEAHMKEKHPRVRNILRNINWRNCSDSTPNEES